MTRIEDAYRQFFVRAHARGLSVYGGTLTPVWRFGYYHPDAANELDRQQVNEWIRQRENFDGVIDFDRGRSRASRSPQARVRFRRSLGSFTPQAFRRWPMLSPVIVAALRGTTAQAMNSDCP